MTAKRRRAGCVRKSPPPRAPLRGRVLSASLAPGETSRARRFFVNSPQSYECSTGTVLKEKHFDEVFRPSERISSSVTTSQNEKLRRQKSSNRFSLRPGNRQIRKRAPPPPPPTSRARSPARCPGTFSDASRTVSRTLSTYAALSHFYKL